MNKDTQPLRSLPFSSLNPDVLTPKGKVSPQKIAKIEKAVAAYEKSGGEVIPPLKDAINLAKSLVTTKQGK